MNKELKKQITDTLIANRQEFNRLNYIVNEFKSLIYDKDGYFLNGKEVYDFIQKQNERLDEIDNRPRDYNELYESEQ